MDRCVQVLFLCTGNSARSILGEAILARRGAPHFRAMSAGSDPRPSPHAVALALLEARGHPTGSFRSQSWHDYAWDAWDASDAPDAPDLDLVITVCDSAAGESCPIWPGAPLTVHWGLPDPAACAGSAKQVRQAFEETYVALDLRIEKLVELGPAAFEPGRSRDDLRAQIQQIHEVT